MKTILKFICGLTVLAVLVHPARAAGGRKFSVTTLSSRPDMVSGGDVLVQIAVPATIPPEKVVIKLNGEPVTSGLQPDAATHTVTGLVTGLKIGENKLEVFNGSAGKPVARLALKNYAITGPIFSGPQEQPFVCQTQEFKMLDKSSLGAPLDANCSVKTVVSYVYKSTEPAPPPAAGARGGNGNFPGAPLLHLKPLTSLTTLPEDVAWTTTTTGDKVPFVVRIETGTINRAIYQIVVLSDPTKESELGPFNPPKEWNKRLLYSFGPGCPGGWLKQGANLGVGSMVSDAVEGQGYAEASSTLNVFGNNCNEVLAAETMMMVKERFIKAYGKPEFTISRGGSGGSEQQIPIADNYPGLVDGIIPSLTFPDVLANAQSIIDTQLLNGYYEKVGDALTRDQKLAITGSRDLKDFAADVGRISPTVNCPKQLPKSELYDAATNKTGARCDVFDHAVNVYGRDPATGFARRPVDNTGVQYGLAALNAGKITPAQFLDLNEQIGGYDNDGNPMPARSVADPTALRIAYQTGRVVNGGLGLGKLPIIDVRPYRDSIPGGDVHQKFHSFSVRYRLQRANGTIANDVMLVGPISATVEMGDYAMAKMDEWLTNLQKDTSNKPVMEKILHAKPSDLMDMCQTTTGERIIEPQTATGGKCNELYPAFQSPRMVAGDPAGNDILKCQMKPVSANDYKVSFSDSEKARLASIFPNGVCDWSKAGVEQKAPTRTWITYSDAADQGKLAHPGNLTAGR